MPVEGGGAVTMKMTPSMRLERPPMTPQMKFPSLLLSGVSGGASESTSVSAAGSGAIPTLGGGAQVDSSSNVSPSVACMI